MALPLRAQNATAERRRRAFLSRDEIVGAAAGILERDGYDALTMRAVAAELGVQAAALYRHIAGRDELDDLLFDHLMADCAPVIAGRDWREDMRTVAAAWRARLVGKRDATRIALSLVSVGPNVAPLMEAMLGALRRSGVSDDDVAMAYDACILFVHSLASSEAVFRALASRPEGPPRHTPMSPEWASAYPTIVALADRLFAVPDFDAQFAFGLGALVAAIERRAAGR
ncbi:MAG TPA: TetR/AcrR family transcriptional regulator C-terminal domain-containing protein [Caulobacteraceae bacterium]|nr:TetR/AcrR family transcriptional regulator C-terminal domain-containing protein [Caulobacteraceae bacterium]